MAAAEADAADAVAYYDAQQPGLGAEFVDELEVALSRIMNHPQAWARFTANSRRCLMERFPYGVLNQVCPDRVIVGAIMHLHRDPLQWQARATSSFGEA